MFDEIDFLDPNKLNNKPRRKAQAPATEFVMPQEVKAPSSVQEGRVDTIEKTLHAKEAGGMGVSSLGTSARSNASVPAPQPLPTTNSDTPFSLQVRKKTGPEGLHIDNNKGEEGSTMLQKIKIFVKGVIASGISHKGGNLIQPVTTEHHAPELHAPDSEVRPVDEVVDQAYRAQGLLAYNTGNTAPAASVASKRPKVSSSLFSRAAGDPNIPEVNLLPHLKGGFNLRFRFPIVIGCAGIAAIAIGTAVWYYHHQNGVYTRKSEILQNEIATTEAQLATIQTVREGLDIYKRMEALDKVLGHHTHWLPFLSFIEDKALPDVYYKSLQVTQEGTASMKVEAPSFNKAALQIAAYARDPKVRAVTVSSLEGSAEAEGVITGVAFDIAVKFDPGMVLPNSAGTQAQ